MVELFLIAVGLSMDAFAVAVGKGLSLKKAGLRETAVVGAWFGVFQGLMPMIGFFFGSRFLDRIKAVDHWVAFAILAVVGGNMIREALHDESSSDESSKEKEAERHNRKADSLSAGTMSILAVATSLDALAVGFTFGLLRTRIVPASLFIGSVTFVLSVIGVYVGKAVGARFQKSAAIAGGAVLIGIGCKILLEHLGLFA